MTAIAGSDTTKRCERRAMSVASGTHALHDGYTDLIYVMLPIWQSEFGLTYAAVGLVRGLFAGTMAGLQRQVEISPASTPHANKPLC